LIQFYVESAQEAYDMHIQAFKLAEDSEILLPVMVCMDGWILTHTYEPIMRLEQEAVDAFLPPYAPVQYVTPDSPLTYGSHAEDDVMMEFKYMIHEAQLRAKAKAEAIAREFAELSGRDHGGLIEEYRTEEADVILVAMGSMVGTIKDAIDEMRSEEQKVGLVKVRCFRPFPAEAILQAIKGAGIVVTMDMNVSMGSEGAIALDLKSALYNVADRPPVLSLVVGIASREVTKQTVKDITARAREALEVGQVEERGEWVDLNRAII
jgi:pyruvate ferredoxin oxidoreductase alpha subunit